MSTKEAEKIQVAEQVRNLGSKGFRARKLFIKTVEKFDIQSAGELQDFAIKCGFDVATNVKRGE